MNSFRFLERGIDAELRRQEEIVRSGGEVEQETLHYDPSTGALTSLRSKEEAHDYRYFPEPDLVPLAPTEEMLSRAREALPELPAARASRFESDLGLNPDQAKLLAFRGELGDFFEAALQEDGSVEPAVIANWVTVELVPRLGDADPSESKVEPAALARLVGLVAGKTVSQSAAKEVLDVLAAEGGDPAAIVEERSLGLAGADELEGIVDRALEANPKAVEELRGGKQKAVGAIVGFVMRETKGRADGGGVNRLIRARSGGVPQGGGPPAYSAPVTLENKSPEVFSRTTVGLEGHQGLRPSRTPFRGGPEQVGPHRTGPPSRRKSGTPPRCPLSLSGIAAPKADAVNGARLRRMIA
jgi:aspartyl-tRNA(Asn)/glutamyl-tRNA(Gln) amidotransferase subunit B